MALQTSTTENHNDDVEFLPWLSPPQWHAWSSLVLSESHPTTDRSVIQLTPHLSTTRGVFAVRKSDGSLLGAQVWNEYDEELTVYGREYVVRPSARGLGIGFTLSNEMARRVRDKKELWNVTCHAVPDMVSKYASQETPLIDCERYVYKIHVDQALLAFSIYHRPSASQKVKFIRDLDSAEFEEMLRFDRSVTGRDRGEMLRMHWRKEYVEGTVALSSGRVVGIAGACPTCQPENRLWKIGPIYCDDLPSTSALVVPLLRKVLAREDKAVVVIQMHRGSKGQSLLSPLLYTVAFNEGKMNGVRMLTHPLRETVDWQRMIVPHIHGHVDV